MVTKVKHIADDIISTDHLDPNASLTFADLTLTGNLTVQGTTTTLDTTNLNVEDKNITLNYGTGDTSSNANGAGITIQDAVDASNNATLTWNASLDKFDLSHGLHIGDSAAIGDATTPALQIGGTTTYRLGIYTTTEGAIIDNANGDDGIMFHTKNAGEAARIDAAGNVGIGRTPAAYGSFKVLDLAGSSGAIQKLIHTGGVSNVELQSYASSTLGVVGTATSHPLLFTTGDVERMRIDSSGHVGIGRTPESDYYSGIKALALGNGPAIYASTSGNPNLTFNDNLFINSAGNNEYQTSNPGTRLEQFNGALTFSNAPSGTAGQTATLTERFRIAANGNVGINSNSPTSYGNSQATLVIEDSTGPAISWNDTGQTRDWFAIAQGSGLHFNYADAGGSSSASNVTSALILDNSGHVGIGVDPTAGSSSLTTLNVSGAIMTLGSSNSNARHYLFESRYAGSNHLSMGYIANGSTHTAGFVSSQNNLPLFLGVGTADNLVLTSNKNVGLNGGAQIGAGSGFGPANNAAGHGTIKLYNTSNGNMDFNQSYSHARYYFYHGGNEVLRIEDGGHSGVYGYSFVQTTTHGAVGYGALNSGYHHTMALSGPSTFYWNNRCEASNGFHTYSDERLKENITNITGALDKVALMNGVTFNWKDTEERNKGETGKQFGVTAQNMLTVDPELPSLNPDPLATQAELDNDELDTDYYSMDYSRITPFLIEAVKELKTKLEAAEARITELEG